MVGFPKWVSEGSIRKYNRAVVALQTAKLPVTEEAVKELYIKYQGLVLETPVEETQDEVIVEAPKKKGKK